MAHSIVSHTRIRLFPASSSFSPLLRLQFLLPLLLLESLLPLLDLLFDLLLSHELLKCDLLEPLFFFDIYDVEI